METTSFGFAASLLFVGVPTIFLIGLFVSTSDGEKSSFYSDTSKGRLSPEPKKWFKTFSNKRSQVFAWDHCYYVILSLKRSLQTLFHAINGLRYLVS